MCIGDYRCIIIQCNPATTSVPLLAFRGVVDPGELACHFKSQWLSLAGGQRPPKDDSDSWWMGKVCIGHGYWDEPWRERSRFVACSPNDPKDRNWGILMSISRHIPYTEDWNQHFPADFSHTGIPRNIFGQKAGLASHFWFFCSRWPSS